MQAWLPRIITPVTERQRVQVLLWRDDLLNPDLPGNKARKLKYNLLAAREQGQHTLLTFGGAYSNHLAAVAVAGRQQGFLTIGFVRGEETLPLNPTLRQCAADGMRLHYLDRASYRRKEEPSFLSELNALFGPAYVLPEGGTNALALRGMAELVDDIRLHTAFDALAVPVGTGGTLAGILLGLNGETQAVGVAALKGATQLATDIDHLTQQAAGASFSNYTIQTDYHFGGYARYSAPLLAFIEEFRMQHGIWLDPIYTGKLLFGVLDLVNKGHFQPGSTVVAVHTGGLQAWAGWLERFDG